MTSGNVRPALQACAFFNSLQLLCPLMEGGRDGEGIVCSGWWNTSSTLNLRVAHGHTHELAILYSLNKNVVIVEWKLLLLWIGRKAQFWVRYWLSQNFQWSFFCALLQTLSFQYNRMSCVWCQWGGKAATVLCQHFPGVTLYVLLVQVEKQGGNLWAIHMAVDNFNTRWPVLPIPQQSVGSKNLQTFSAPDPVSTSSPFPSPN